MTDVFLNVQGIKGESTDAAHKDWCEVLTAQWGVKQPAAGTSGERGRGAERADFMHLVVLKDVDRATPPLAVACASGRVISKVVAEFCRAGGTGQKLYLRLTLKDAYVANQRLFSQAGKSEGASQLEEVSFSYNQIQVEYFEMTHKGKLASSPFNFGWDLRTNKST